MRSTPMLLVILAVVLAAPVSPAHAQRTDAERLHALFDDYHAWTVAEFPDEARRRGDAADADRITDRSLAAIERRHLDRIDFRDRLDAIPRDDLDESDVVSAELLERILRRDLGDHLFKTYLLPLGSRSGPQLDVPSMADAVRFGSARAYEDYLARLALVPGAIDDVIERGRLGMAEGRTPPRLVVEPVPAQIDALLAGDGLARLGAPFDELPEDLDEGERNALRLRYERTVRPAVVAALERLRAFVAETYLPACRASIAAGDGPDGAAYYAHRLAVMTTTELSAQEIHEIGLSEVTRLRTAMLEVIRRTDFLERFPERAGDDDETLFRRFVEYLRTDPRFYHRTPEALLTGYRDICKRVDPWLPKFFDTLPRLTYGVKEVPAYLAPRTTTASYERGSIANAEPGWFCANTWALDQRPRYEMIALAMHESVPGHHLQIALAQELEDVPAFRRFARFTAFSEGWALYAERLGVEMGLYDDPYDDFGRLTDEMWRACGLVVDPGIHALGWTRQRAIDFMLENSARSAHDVEIEVDRSIAWPGRACADKIGEMRITGLRGFAERRFGPAFDVRAFHEVVLGAGAVPLDVLQRRVKDWCRRRPGGSVYD